MMNQQAGKIRISDGTELAYCERGNGIPLILLHAFPLSQQMWNEQSEFLSQTHRVITFDWRGFGESSSGNNPSTMENFANDLAELMDALKIERAGLCGLSMGGYAAFAFYRKYPQRVSSLILADTRSGADSEEGKRARYEMAELALKTGTSAITEQMIPRLLGKVTLQSKPQIATQVRKMIEASAPEAIAAAQHAMAQRQDSTDLLAQIHCPTLIIAGSDDVLTPVAEAEMMATHIRISQLKIINEAGHLSNLERPNEFNQAVSGFLKSL